MEIDYNSLKATDLCSNRHCTLRDHCQRGETFRTAPIEYIASPAVKVLHIEQTDEISCKGLVKIEKFLTDEF